MDFRVTGVDAIKSAMEQYGGGNANYFSIANDEETKKVRFAHGDDKDLDIFVVHKIKLAGKDTYVACLASVGQACPLCQAGHRPTVRMFLSLQDCTDGNKMKVWDRGKNDIPNILGLVTRYGRLDSRYYDIQRHGKKGDKDTKYQYFPHDPSADCQSPLKREPIIGENGFVLERSAEGMKELLAQIDLSAPTGFNSAPQTGNAPGKMF